jgi:hypothetical protein
VAINTSAAVLAGGLPSIPAALMSGRDHEPIGIAFVVVLLLLAVAGTALASRRLYPRLHANRSLGSRLWLFAKAAGRVGAGMVIVSFLGVLALVPDPYAGTDLLAVLAILAGAWTIAALTATVILGIVNLVLLESYLGLHPKH